MSKSFVSALVVLLTFCFLLTGLASHQSLWLDEATSVLAARNYSYLGILSVFSPADFHPPLYYLVLKFWILVGGSGENWIRLLSIIATAGTAVLVYEVARLFVEPKWAIFSGSLFATGPLAFYYSHEARMYAMAAFLVTLSMWSFLKWHLTTKKLFYFLWIFGLVLAIYSDYLPILIIPVFVTGIFGKVKLRMATFLGLLVVFLCYLPWTPVFLQQLRAGVSVQGLTPGWWKVLGTLSLKSVALIWVKMLIGRISFADKIVYSVVVFVATAVFGIAAAKSLRLKTLVGWFIIPLVLGVLLALKIPVIQYFRFLFVVPAFYLLVGLGASRLGRGAAVVLLSLNLIFDGVYLTSPSLYREDWRAAANYISRFDNVASVSLFPNNAQADAYRYYGQPAPVSTIEQVSRQKTSQVWLFRYVQEIFDPQDLLPKQLESLGYRKIEEKSFNGGVLVWKYQR